MKQISLLGCGKLGYPLAIELLKQGHMIKGSTTTMEKMSKLKNAGITPYLININKKIDLDFFNSDILVLKLPYKKSFSDPNIYKTQINSICKDLESSPIKHLVFTSSSSIYPKDKKEYLPTSTFLPATERATILKNCENKILSLKNISTIIIRLGGIYGSNRNIKTSNKTRRLIKESDAINLLVESINRKGENDIINGFKQIII